VIVTVLPVPCSLSPRVVVVPPLTMIPLIAMSRSIVMHWHMCEYVCVCVCVVPSRCIGGWGWKHCTTVPT
jgi:hypothetical protein